MESSQNNKALSRQRDLTSPSQGERTDPGISGQLRTLSLDTTISGFTHAGGGFTHDTLTAGGGFTHDTLTAGGGFTQDTLTAGGGFTHDTLTAGGGFTHDTLTAGGGFTQDTLTAGGGFTQDTLTAGGGFTHDTLTAGGGFTHDTLTAGGWFTQDTLTAGGGFTQDTLTAGGGFTHDTLTAGGGFTQDTLTAGGGFTHDTLTAGGGFTHDTLTAGGGFTQDTLTAGGGFTHDTLTAGGGFTHDTLTAGGGFTHDTLTAGGGFTQDTLAAGGGFTQDTLTAGGGFTQDTLTAGGGFTQDTLTAGGGFTQDTLTAGGWFTHDTLTAGGGFTHDTLTAGGGFTHDTLTAGGGFTTSVLSHATEALPEEDGNSEPTSLKHLLLTTAKAGDYSLRDHLLSDNEDREGYVIPQNMLDAALLDACAEKSTFMVKTLVRLGADVNNQSAEDRKTALHIAAREDCVDIADFLLSKKADIDSIDLQGNTPLFLACSSGMVKVLLAHRAEVNIQNLLGVTPLMKAVSNADINSVEMLILAGSDLKTKNDNGTTARDIAIAERLGLEFYIDSFQANIAEKDNNVLAEYTTDLESADIEKTVLNFGDHSEEEKCGSGSALTSALTSGQVGHAEVLLQNHTPSEVELEELVETLTERGLVESLQCLADHCKINAICQNKLDSAILSGKRAKVQLLIDFGAEINAPPDNGWPALFVALRRDGHGGPWVTAQSDIEGHEMREMVKLLVENGAHINTYTDDFDSPLHEAVTLRRHPQVIQYLIEQGVEEKDGEHNRVVLSEFFDYNKQGQRCSKTLELLLATGCDPNLPFESGNFALNQAVADRDLGIIRQLLKAGANVENRAFDVTPLYLAAYRSRPEVFKLLKSLGADMAADTRCNPLVTFLEGCDGHGTLDETLTLALLLEDYKDQINVPAYDSGTALVVAAQRGYLDGVKVLLELGADPHMVSLNQGQEQTALSNLVSFEHLFSGLYDRTLTNYKVLCAEELIKHGALATLPKGCGLHLVHLILCDERELLQLFLRHTMGPL